MTAPEHHPLWIALRASSDELSEACDTVTRADNRVYDEARTIADDLLTDDEFDVAGRLDRYRQVKDDLAAAATVMDRIRAENRRAYTAWKDAGSPVNLPDGAK